MHLILGSDHAGYDLKIYLLNWLNVQGYQTEDVGCHDKSMVDYNDFADLLVKNISHDTYGILVCGSGIGMCMAANRFKGIRAAVCTSSQQAYLARAHNDSNVICLGARLISQYEAESILQVFLDTQFLEGHYIKRVQKLDA